MKVLVVEDDAQLAELLERVLGEEGHEPTLCGTLRTAVGALATSSFDIVILDRMLPDGDGLELCGALRRRNAATPTLMLTARGGREFHVRSERASSKPSIALHWRAPRQMAQVSGFRSPA